MPIKTSDRMRSQSRGTPAQALTVLKQWGSFPTGDVTDFVNEVYRLCALVGLDAAILIAHAAVETGSPTDGRGFVYSNWATKDAYRSKDNRYNPSGLGITDGGDLGYGFAGGTEAARGHVVHHAVYAIPASDPAWIALEPYLSLDPRYSAVPKANRGTITTLADLEGKWWTTKGGANNVAARGNAIFPSLPNQGAVTGTPSTTTTPAPKPTGDSAMATFKKYDLPGLANPVYFPDWLIVEIKLIPSSVDGWTSGQKVPASQFVTTTFHDTDNLTSNATSEYTWARNGGRGAINSPGSYNGIYDGKRLIITQRFDELVGHAANPTGNVTSYAFEMAFGVDGYAASLVVGEWVHAGILQAMGKSGGTESMYLHQFWSGKYCSRQVLDHGDWGVVEKTVDAHVAEINAWVRAQAGGTPTTTTTPAPSVTYAKPVPIPDLVGFPVSDDTTVPGVVTRDGGDAFIFTADLYEAVVATPRLQYADIKNSPKVGPDLKPGEKFIGAWLVKARDGEWYIVTPYWTRILLKDVKRIGDVPNLAAGAA